MLPDVQLIRELSVMRPEYCVPPLLARTRGVERQIKTRIDKCRNTVWVVELRYRLEARA